MKLFSSNHCTVMQSALQRVWAVRIVQLIITGHCSQCNGSWLTNMSLFHGLLLFVMPLMHSKIFHIRFLVQGSNVIIVTTGSNQYFSYSREIFFFKFASVILLIMYSCFQLLQSCLSNTECLPAVT